MSDPGPKEIDDYFGELNSKIVELNQGITDMELVWKLPEVHIRGDENPEEIKAIIKNFCEEAKELKDKVVELKESRRRKNMELLKKYLDLEEEIRKSDKEYHEKLLLLKENGYDYENELEQGSSSADKEEVPEISEDLGNMSLLSSAEMIGMASFNADITSMPSLSDIPSSTPFVTRKKH